MANPWRRAARAADPRCPVSCWAVVEGYCRNTHPCGCARRPGRLTCGRHDYLEDAAQAAKAATAKPKRKGKA